MSDKCLDKCFKILWQTLCVLQAYLFTLGCIYWKNKDNFFILIIHLYILCCKGELFSSKSKTLLYKSFQNSEKHILKRTVSCFALIFLLLNITGTFDWVLTFYTILHQRRLFKVLSWWPSPFFFFFFLNYISILIFISYEKFEGLEHCGLTCGECLV